MTWRAPSRLWLEALPIVAAMTKSTGLSGAPNIMHVMMSFGPLMMWGMGLYGLFNVLCVLAIAALIKYLRS
jgi:hypothetical protein